MKKLYVLLIILISMVLLNGCGKKQESAGNDSRTDESVKKEQSKDVAVNENTSYHVTYKMDKEGSGMTMDLYRKGNKAKSEITSKAGNDEMKASAYYADKVVYTISEIMGQRIGFKMDLNEMKGKDDKNFGKEMFDAKDHLKDYEKTGKGDVLGYSCDIYKDKEGNQYYFYKDVVMLKVITQHGSMEATKFEPDVKLEDKFFDPPKDVDYTNPGDMDLSKFKMPK